MSKYLGWGREPHSFFEPDDYRREDEEERRKKEEDKKKFIFCTKYLHMSEKSGNFAHQKEEKGKNEVEHRVRICTYDRC